MKFTDWNPIVHHLLVMTIGGLGFIAFIGVGLPLWSFLAGAAVTLLNLLLLTAGWGLILRKKFVALAVLIIVLKYAILVGTVLYFLRKSWILPGFFIVGLSTILPTVLLRVKRRHGV